MDLLTGAATLGNNLKNFLKKKLDEAANFKMNGGQSINQQIANLPKNADNYNIFAQMGKVKTNDPRFDLLSHAASVPLNFAAKNIVAPLAQGGYEAARYTGATAVQAPIYAATQGRVNIPIYSQQEFQNAAGGGNEDILTRAAASGKSAFNKFFVPAANIATVAKAPVNAAIGGTLGAAGKVIDNLTHGKNIGEDIGKGVQTGVEQSWIVALSNGLTNSVLGKLAPKFTDSAMQTAWAGAKGAKQLATMVGKELIRGVLETPADTVGFSGWDSLKNNKNFVQALEDNFIPTLTGNLAFHGGAGAVRASVKGISEALQSSLQKTIAQHAPTESLIKGEKSTKGVVDKELAPTAQSKAVYEAVKDGDFKKAWDIVAEVPADDPQKVVLQDLVSSASNAQPVKKGGGIKDILPKNMDQLQKGGVDFQAQVGGKNTQQLLDELATKGTLGKEDAQALLADPGIADAIKKADYLTPEMLNKAVETGDIRGILGIIAVKMDPATKAMMGDLNRADAVGTGIKYESGKPLSATPQEGANLTVYRHGGAEDVNGRGIFTTTKENIANQYGNDVKEYTIPKDAKIKTATTKWALMKEIAPNFDENATVDRFVREQFRGGGDVLVGGRTAEQRLEMLVDQKIAAAFKKQGYDAVSYSGGSGTDQEGEVQVLNPQKLIPATKNLFQKAGDFLTSPEGQRGGVNFGAKVSNPLKQVQTDTATPSTVVADLFTKKATQSDILKSLKAGDITTDEAQALGLKVIPPELNSPAKMRGFQETVKTNVATPEELAAKQGQNVVDYYNPLTNDTTVNFVKKNILKKGDEYALQVARNGSDTNANATALLLLDKYIKNNQIDDANNLIRDVSPRFTEQGRQVQILSMYGKLTPTGAMKFTQRLLDQANENLPADRQLTLTRENAKEITDLATNIQKLPEGSRERTVAVAQLFDKMASQVPPDLGQKLSTLQTMAQLLNPKTIIRNTVGNAGFAVAENVKDVVATGLDKAVSTVTGQRTKVLPSVGTQLKGAKEGFQLGLEDALKGIDTSASDVTKFDLPNRTFRGGALGTAEKGLNIALRATDRAAYTAARDESLRQQMKAAGVDAPTEEMANQAHLDGLYRTFQDDTKLAGMLSSLKKTLNKVGINEKFGLGDLVIKYPKTPANLLMRGVDYSPAGFAKSAMDLYEAGIKGGSFDQKAFVEDTSRALTGTGMLALGYALAKIGVITGQPNKDSDINAAMRDQGTGGYKFNADAFQRWVTSGFSEDAAKPKPGDTTYSYDWFQPQSFVFSMGANAASPTDGSDPISTGLDALASAEEGLTNQPLVQNLLRYPQNIQQKGFIGATAQTLAGLPASFVPTTVNQVGQLTDNTSRETYDPNVFKQEFNKALARVPGVRNALPARINPENGQPLETYQDGSNNIFNVMFNPAFVSKLKADPNTAEVLSLFDRTGEVKQAPNIAAKTIQINGESKKLTPDEYQKYQMYLGQKAQSLFNDEINSGKYNVMSDQEKVDTLNQILSDVNAAAKMELFGNDQKNASKRARAIFAEGWDPSAAPTTQQVPAGGAGDQSSPASSGELDKYMKAYSLDKYGTNTQTGIKKFTQEKDKLKAAQDLYGGATTYDGFPDEMKQQAIEKLGFRYGDIEYDYKAKQSTDIKTSYILDMAKTEQWDHEALMTSLYEGREVSVGGDQVASNPVIDAMYERNLISSAERTQLKKIKLGQDQIPLNGTTSGAGSGTGSKKSVTDLINAVKKAPTIKPDLGTKTAQQSAQLKVPAIKGDTTQQKITLPKAPTLEQLFKNLQGNGGSAVSAKARQIAASGGGTPPGAKLKLSQSFYRRSA